MIFSHRYVAWLFLFHFRENLIHLCPVSSFALCCCNLPAVFVDFYLGSFFSMFDSPLFKSFDIVLRFRCKVNNN